MFTPQQKVNNNILCKPVKIASNNLGSGFQILRLKTINFQICWKDRQQNLRKTASLQIESEKMKDL